MAALRGVGRVADDDRSLLLCFDECPSDDLIRHIHDNLPLILSEQALQAGADAGRRLDGFETVEGEG